MQQRHLQLFVLVISLPLLLLRPLPCTAAVAVVACGSSIHQNPCPSGFRKPLIPGFAVMRGPRGGPRLSSKAASRRLRSSSQGSPAAKQQQHQLQQRQQQQRQQADAARHAAACSSSQVSLGEETDISRNTLKGLFSGLRELDVLSAFAGPQGSLTKPVLGVPIAEAVSKSSSCSSSKLQQILKAGDYSRLRPSFLGSFLLPVQPTEQQQQQANSGGAPEYVASHCFPAAAAEEDDVAAAAAADTPRGTLRERLLQQLLQGLLQQQQLPEIAVAGRSNVGKSSLINAFFKLCSSSSNNTSNGSKLPHARSSRTPGRTQAVDFYLFSVAAASTQRNQHQQQHQQQQQQLLLQRGALVLADLPGYGHTEGISPERAWQISRTLEVYVQRKQQQQQQLQQVLLLIDGRRGMGAHDAALMRLLLQQKIPIAVAITKEDRLSAAQFVELVENLSAYKHLVLPPYLMKLRMKLLLEQQRCSSSKNKGRSDDCNKSSSSSSENEERDDGGDDVYSSSRSNWSSKSASRGSLFSSFRSPYASDTPVEQQVQQEERSKQQVPVFLVSARTGSGIKQLWQHVLRTAAKGPPRANLATAGAAAAAATPAAAATAAAEQPPPSLKRRAEMSRRMALLLAGPEHMPDDCF